MQILMMQHSNTKATVFKMFLKTKIPALHDCMLSDCHLVDEMGLKG
jgi:hypothetical protein